MARTVDDAELLLSVLAGFSEADPHSVPVGPLSTLRRGGSNPPRVGVSLDWGYAPVEAQVRSTVSAAIDLMADVLGWRTEEFNPRLGGSMGALLGHGGGRDRSEGVAATTAGIRTQDDSSRCCHAQARMDRRGIASAHVARLALCQQVSRPLRPIRPTRHTNRGGPTLWSSHTGAGEDRRTDRRSTEVDSVYVPVQHDRPPGGVASLRVDRRRPSNRCAARRTAIRQRRPARRMSVVRDGRAVAGPVVAHGLGARGR